MISTALHAVLVVAGVLGLAGEPLAAQERARARDLGIAPGRLPTGPHNAITDVPGVRVGHATVNLADSVRTGVTAVLPHGDNAFLSRVPAAIHVGNGFGKLLGSTQVNELGELETPILLTCTLCVWRAADALVGWMLERQGMERVRSINPVVAETNDGSLNAIRSRPIEAAHVRTALESADSGRVAEGSVGAGTGTIAFGWKGGIGTASRRVEAGGRSFTVGVLVQSNFGGAFQVEGVPVWRELPSAPDRRARQPSRGDGSIIMVVATDAPVSDRNLRRLASRAMLGLARTGSSASNGSGDYVIAFSTAREVRRDPMAGTVVQTELANEAISPLFEGVVEATEEAIYNSIFMATSVTSRGGTVEAIPLAELRRILSRYRAEGR
ncbi:MAG TPA: P1 family peptidase [Gemmatimonadales bacterium]